MEQALSADPINPVEQAITELSELGKGIVRKAIEAYNNHLVSLDTSGVQKSGNMDDCSLVILDNQYKCRYVNEGLGYGDLAILKWYEGFASTSAMISRVNSIISLYT